MAGFVQKIKNMWTPPDDEYDEVYAEDEQEEDEEGFISPIDNRDREPASRRSSSGASYSGGSKVVNIHTTAQLQVVLFKPQNFAEETRPIADELLKMHTVVLNLEKTEKEASLRIIDFLSGVAYANGGKIKRVATNTYIIIPYNVDLTGDDLIDELENNGEYY